MTKTKNGTLKFSLFSDFHYLRGHYVNTLGDLQAILDRAAASEVDLVIQAGDFCQNRIDSPELDDVYLNNRYGLPVYGIYGNHDMEWHRRDQSNNMKLITPLLTNDQSVIISRQTAFAWSVWIPTIRGARKGKRGSIISPVAGARPKGTKG